MTRVVVDGLFNFKIGDEVRMKVHREGYAANGQKFTPQRLVVVERIAQECYGGLQISYALRVHTHNQGGWLGSETYGFVTELIKVTEPELVAFPEPELSAEKPPRKPVSERVPDEPEET